MLHLLLRSVRTLCLLMLLIPIVLGLNLKPVMATAYTASVDSPSMVRAGEGFAVTVNGKYEDITGPANLALPVAIIELTGVPNTQVAIGTYTVDLPSGVWSGNWWLQLDLQAYAPAASEYDASGEYTWQLKAQLVGSVSHIPFSVVITKPDADPHVKITETYVAASSGKVSELLVGDLGQVHLLWEYSGPAGSLIEFKMRNSLKIYGYGHPDADGWIGEGGPIDAAKTSGFLDIPLPAPAPLEPAPDWLWEFKVHIKTLDGREATDQSSLTLPVLARDKPWAKFVDASVPGFVHSSDHFYATLKGAYIFPAGSSGGLEIDIVHEDDSPIAGGQMHIMPGLSGAGPFGQSFHLTAPPTEGELVLKARLRMSGSPDIIAVHTMHLMVSLMVPNYFCKIDSVQISPPGAPPPQDVTYGSPFNIWLKISWNLPPDSAIGLTIYDWSGLVAPIAFDYFALAPGGPGSNVNSIFIAGVLIPPHNGPWTLRAEAKYIIFGGGGSGESQSTPVGYENVFWVNVVGAPAAGPGGTSDWAVTGISTSPVDPFLGTDVTFLARVEVSTSDPLPQTVTVSYSLDGIEQLKDSVTYQPGMAFLAVPSPLWTPTVGQHTVKWQVDPDKNYNDKNWANNVREATFTVTETQPQPPPPPLGEAQPPPPPAGEAFDFYVTAVPTEQTVQSPVTYAVTVDVTAGTPQPVQLDLTGAPPGVSYYFSPPSGIPSFTSTLTVTTASTVPAGSYPLTISASSAETVRYKPLTLKVEK